MPSSTEKYWRIFLSAFTSVLLDNFPWPSHIEESNIFNSVQPHSLSETLPGITTEPVLTKYPLDEAHTQAELSFLIFQEEVEQNLYVVSL